MKKCFMILLLLLFASSMQAAELLLMTREDSPRFGEVMNIKPDGWGWGSQERNPDKYIVLKIPGVSPDSLTVYLEPLLKKVLRDTLDGKPCNTCTDSLEVVVYDRNWWIKKTIVNQLCNNVDQDGTIILKIVDFKNLLSKRDTLEVTP